MTVIPLLIGGCAYHDLKKEIAEHQSVGLEFSPPEMPQPTATVDHNDFSATKAELQARKKQWRQSITNIKTGARFFQPEPILAAKFKPIAANSPKTALVMANSFKLKKLELLIFYRDPAIQAAEARFRAALETYSQVTGLDDILRQYSAFTESLMVGIGPMKGKKATDFPFPGVLALKGEIANQETRAAWETYQIAIRKRLTIARETFWNLAYNSQAQDITRETLNLFQRLETVAKTRYEAGRTSFQDVIHIRIKKETLAEELLSLQKKRQPLTARLRESLDLENDVTIGEPELIKLPSQLPDTKELEKQALTYRQEIRRLEAKVGKMERMLTLAETMILPPYTTNISRFSDEAVLQVGSDAMKDSFQLTPSAQRGAGLPKKPWFGWGNAYLQQTRQKLAGMRQDLHQTQNATKTLVQEGWFNLDRATREQALYEDSIVNLSQIALEVVTRGYESGTVSFADVIASHTTWLYANLSKAGKNKDTGIAWARLEATVGKTLNNSHRRGDLL